MDQTQTSDDAPLLTHSTPQSEQTTLLAQQKPLVTIVHASVGSVIAMPQMRLRRHSTSSAAPMASQRMLRLKCSISLILDA